MAVGSAHTYLSFQAPLNLPFLNGCHSMGKHDPANIFIVAEQFRSADKMLHMILRGELTAGGEPVPFEVSVPMVTCAAFAFELYLKCLVSMETGSAPPNTHELDKLFDMLHPDTRKQIREFFDQNGSSTIAHIKGEFERASKPAPAIDFDYVLHVSRRGFPIARYIYEGLPAEQGWVAEMIMEGARAVILKRWPGWEKARQITPTIVLDGPQPSLIPTPEPALVIPELSIVALRHSRQCSGAVLPAGAKGTVVHAYRGGAGYEVEFAEPFHCVVTVACDDIEPA